MYAVTFILVTLMEVKKKQKKKKKKKKGPRKCHGDANVS